MVVTRSKSALIEKSKRVSRKQPQNETVDNMSLNLLNVMKKNATASLIHEDEKHPVQEHTIEDECQVEENPQTAVTLENTANQKINLLKFSFLISISIALICIIWTTPFYAKSCNDMKVAQYVDTNESGVEIQLDKIGHLNFSGSHLLHLNNTRNLNVTIKGFRTLESIEEKKHKGENQIESLTDSNVSISPNLDMRNRKNLNVAQSFGYESAKAISSLLKCMNSLSNDNLY